MKNLNEFFAKDVVVVNIGLRGFYDDLTAQKKHVVHVDWRPPAGGNPQLQAILERMRAKK